MIAGALALSTDALLYEQFRRETGIVILRRQRRQIAKGIRKEGPALQVLAGGRAPGPRPGGAAGQAATATAAGQVPPDAQQEIRRDFREFCRRLLKKEPYVYQLHFAGALIYAFRRELFEELGDWPVYEWPDVPKLTDKKKALIDEHRKIVGLQPRQSGKSETLSMVVPYLITVLPRFRAGVFAPKEEQAKDYIYKRVRDSLEFNPAYAGRFKALNALDLELNGQDEVLPAATRASGGYFAARSAAPTANIEGNTLHLAIVDEAQDVSNARVSKSIFPMLAATNGVLVKIGTVAFVRNHFYECLEGRTADSWVQIIIKKEEVEAANPLWAQFKRRYIVEEGEHSDNVQTQIYLRWMLQRGMFITEAELSALYDEGLGVVSHQKTGIQFAGIDVAKVRDKTVVTVIEVFPDRLVDGFVPARVLAWKTLQGTDYVGQFNEIKQWFDDCFNVIGVCIDDTGGRGGLADQFLHTRYRVEAFTFTSPMKSEGYTWLQTIIRTTVAKVNQGFTADRLLTIPADEATRATPEFNEFEDEGLDLQREYHGRYLSVHHPEGEGYHDDYWDSGMLAVWIGCRGVVQLDPEQLKQIADTEAAALTEAVWGNQGDGPRQGGRRRGDGDADMHMQIKKYMGDDLEAPD